MTPVLDYFEDNYIGRKRRRVRANSPFAHAVWNVHERAEQELPRTNNNIEGWHRRLQAAVSAHHPNIWKFIKVLKRKQSLVDVEVNQALGRHEPAPQRRQYAALDTRILTLVRDYGNRDVLDYLRGIGHNLSF